MLFRFTWGWEEHVGINTHPAPRTMSLRPLPYRTVELWACHERGGSKPPRHVKGAPLGGTQCACRLKPQALAVACSEQ